MTAAIANLHTWQTRRIDARSRAAKIARLEQLEQWQAGRLKAAVALAELIDRRQVEIDNLRGQLA